ncbi:MAG TPA: hypothetical protein VMN36_10945 [Verrucomicrobiales bacterium]|nr:hypothetical protein [Verrucomicrobiales bacterium]
MTGAELAEIFREEVPHPTHVQGDSWGLDATTEDILRLIDAPPDSLKADDFSGYLGYCTTGGDEDLRFLFSPILRIWESALYERDSCFTQYFHHEVCRTDFVERALVPRLRQATCDFVVRALSSRLGAETSLSIYGVSTSHDWFEYVASFGVFTTAIPALWDGLWHSAESGHATAMLQYLSCLLYEGSNPIFAPWRCDKGGGPPALWGYDSVGFGESWKQENLSFLSSALHSEGIRDWLERTSKVHSGEQAAEVAKHFLMELDGCANAVDERIKLLLIALQSPSDVGIVTWESLRNAATNAKC